MPASSVPTICTDYLSGHDAEIQFVSTSYDVSSACQSFIRSEAEANLLWTEQPPQVIPIATLTDVCSLSSNDGSVTASVVDDASQTYGQAACNGLISAGWQSAPAPNQPPLSNVKPTSDAPVFEIPRGEGNTPSSTVEPSGLAFSADGGNIVTGITWSEWGDAQALGVGTSDIQNCVPNCAQGSNTPVTTTITLLDPVDGHYTALLEERAGLTSLATYSSAPATGTMDDEDWPWDVNPSAPSG